MANFRHEPNLRMLITAITQAYIVKPGSVCQSPYCSICFAPVRLWE